MLRSHQSSFSLLKIQLFILKLYSSKHRRLLNNDGKFVLLGKNRGYDLLIFFSITLRHDHMGMSFERYQIDILLHVFKAYYAYITEKILKWVF
jgi:hypothetical protein